MASGHQLRQQVQQFGAAVGSRASQAVDQGLFVESAEPLLAQRRPRAIAHQVIEALPVPVRDRHRGVDRPAAGVLAAVKDMKGVIVEVAVALQPAQAALAHLCLNLRAVIPFQVHCRVEHRRAVTWGPTSTSRGC
jgi:hypothetical protein